MKVLFIEDDEDKARRVTEFIASDFPDAKVVGAKSFNTGLRELIRQSGVLDLVLLDMTMPSYDVTPDEPNGGSVEHFAGKDLLAQMQLRRIHIPTIVVTMFDSFGHEPKKVSLETLSNELSIQHTPYYLGHVYYNSTEDGWRDPLKRMIDMYVKKDRGK